MSAAKLLERHIEGNKEGVIMTAEFDVKVKIEFDGMFHYVLINGLRSSVRAKEKHVANVYANVIRLAMPTLAKAFSVAMKGEK